MQVSLLSVMDVAAGLRLLLAPDFDQEYLRSANTGLGKLSGFQHAHSYPSCCCIFQCWCHVHTAESFHMLKPLSKKEARAIQISKSNITLELLQG